MKLLAIVVCVALGSRVYGQNTPRAPYDPKGWNFTENCFRNPGLPYCDTRNFVDKKAKKSGQATYGSSTGKPTIDGAGIDWRFADPLADMVAVVDGSRLAAAPFAHSLIDQLAVSQGLTAAESQKIFRALSSIKQVAISARQTTIVILVNGRPADAVLPALENGWQARPLSPGSLLIGHADAVDQAYQRLLSDIELGDLPTAAQHRAVGSEFWMAGSAQLAGQQAASAGVKRFELMASMKDSLVSDTLFEFDGAPDPNAIQSWAGTLGGAKIDGNAVHVSMSMNSDQLRANPDRIALSALGQNFATILISARYFPVTDTSTTVHTKPVIFGLDGGPKEVK